MKLYAPELSFRGARNYVHSTDLYEHLLAGLTGAGIGPVDGPMMLTIRRKIAAQPEFHFFPAGDAREGASADFLVTARSQEIRGVIRESIRPVLQQREYDERPIWNAATITDDTVTITRADLSEGGKYFAAGK